MANLSVGFDFLALYNCVGKHSNQAVGGRRQSESSEDELDLSSSSSSSSSNRDRPAAVVHRGVERGAHKAGQCASIAVKSGVTAADYAARANDYILHYTAVITEKSVDLSLDASNIIVWGSLDACNFGVMWVAGAASFCGIPDMGLGATMHALDWTTRQSMIWSNRCVSECTYYSNKAMKLSNKWCDEAFRKCARVTVKQSKAACRKGTAALSTLWTTDA